MKWKKTHSCGELRGKHQGLETILAGWVDRIRDFGGVLFITLRDREGLVQAFIPQEKKELFEEAQKIGIHYVISVRGKVQARPKENINPDLPTGEIEVEVEDLEILNTCEPLPLSIDDRDFVSEEVRMRYRYLDLHRRKMQKALALRHKVCLESRKFLDQEGFWEVETPILTKSTPEGARDYLVPSRIHPGCFYALPQSPQLFKQLLMIGGVEKYFQICRCFRDEDLRADRQPEFSQIDMEMSFVSQDDVLDVTERMYHHIFKETLGVELPLPFPRLSYQEAKERFGLDKPDLRFGMELQDISDLAGQTEFKVFQNALNQGGKVKAIVAKGAAKEYSRKKIDELSRFVGDYGAKGLAWMKVEKKKITSPIAKFFPEDKLKELRKRLGLKEGDLVFLVADQEEVCFAALGHLRNRLAKELGLMDPKKFSILWVVDFPLFTYNEEEERYESEHHPFTSPHPEDIPLLDKDPAKVRSLSYDLVLNGFEVGSGSIRIHRREVQEKIFQILQLSEEDIEQRFGFFLKALSYGAPPHGGIAPGLDRTVMIMAGYDDIREVIPFPKTLKASCLMTESPSPVSPQQLEDLHISIVAKENSKK
ncbi:MAG: aspartate--tRNA ligase [Planctomycetota bacterium]|nr:MAG: aspartate--tRNA ligase [Planctomycetota bacterium]